METLRQKVEALLAASKANKFGFSSEEESAWQNGYEAALEEVFELIKELGDK